MKDGIVAPLWLAVGGTVACAPAPESPAHIDTGETATLPGSRLDPRDAPPECAALADRPARFQRGDWTADLPERADALADIRPAASWDGLAGLLHAGPVAGGQPEVEVPCSPCTYRSEGRPGLSRLARELALEFELGCEVDPLPRTDAWAVASLQIRLFQYPAKVVEPEVLLLTSVDLDGDRCIRQLAPGVDALRRYRDQGVALEPGRYLTHRIPLAPLVEAAGADPGDLRVDTYDVTLRIDAGTRASAWIELGRTLADACP
ncbi:MAG: hypothetical protein H6732_07200 [Alphaproteobacteria bacterium]|nr:hypothetical protein [Alphaproteobacteria bacterium]